MSANDDPWSEDNDDDDEDFLAAAIEIEAARGNDPSASPRPSKRRKLTPPAEQSYATGSIPVAALDQENVPEEDPEYYLPGELSQDNEGPKKSRHKIHIPRDGGHIPHQIVSQTQHGLDNSPTRIRGPIWKRPSSRPSMINEEKYGQPRIMSKNIVNYFQPQQTSTHAEAFVDDAALAAHLQAQEDDLAQQHNGASQLTSTRSAGAASVMSDELANLPSDAFSSPNFGRTSENVVVISSQDAGVSHSQGRSFRESQSNLKQRTIFGGPAAQDSGNASQAATNRRAWPLKSRDEPPTHHKLNESAMATWIYPTNIGTIRDYQFNIVSRSLYHNTLVALPTGLGKTFIAATIMLNYYNWTTEAQLVFMAPTKPLIAQQMDACYHIVGIPRSDTVLMTGETSPANRATEWLEKRVFFMTPQTVINDLKTGICDPKKIVLIVVDEAHKATGGYAYTEVVSFLRRFNNSFRVLALTATPGSSVESVQAVMNNLGIARVELRTEQSLDIRQYTHEKETETEVFEFSDEQARIMDLISKTLRPIVEKLCSQNAYWSRDPMQLTAYGLTMARQKWMASDAGRRAPMNVKGMINAAIVVLSSLAHNIGLLKFHGIRPFYSGFLSFQKTVDSGQSKGKTASQVAHSQHFVQMMTMVRAWTNNPDFLGHPKLDYLRSVVLNHFLDAGEGRQGADAPPSATRVMVFVNYRDSAEDICRALKRNEPMIRPHVFVGQAASKGSEGMDQKRQNAVIQDFKAGKYNTLVATSIGEEGLDIGTVDLIVCYDASSSPIRMLQRIGRTGRKRIGRVVLLLMKGKEENDYAKAQDNYAWIQKTIADESRYTYCDDQSPRIVPKHIQPVVDKRMIEIPLENSQPIDLNEKNRKGRGKGKAKRPPKKFHLPDGVQTGFIKASKLGDEEALETDDAPRAKKKQPTSKRVTSRSSLPQPEPEAVQLPFLNDVLLTHSQRLELEQKYAQTLNAETDTLIRGPDLDTHSHRLRTLSKTKYVRHGRAAGIVSRTLAAINKIDDAHVDRMKEAFDRDDLKREEISLPSPESLGMDFLGCKQKSPHDSPEAVDAALSKTKKPRSTLSRKASSIRKEASARPAQNSRVQNRPKKKAILRRNESYGSAADEGDESSPEPTPADMRIATQGIDLGSRDTSGEDEDDNEPDSELEAFIANSSDPIEMASSSQPHLGSARESRYPRGKGSTRRTHLDIFSSSDDEDQDMTAKESDSRPTGNARSRRIIMDSDDSDE